MADQVREYAFDVKLLTTVRVRAASEDEARNRLRFHLDAADSNFGAWTDGPDAGQPILGEASMDGEADLFEVDGEEDEAGEEISETELSEEIDQLGEEIDEQLAAEGRPAP